MISELTNFFKERETRRNVWTLVKYLFFLLGVIVLFSVFFHVIMTYEGRSHSWITGVYWTLTVMSTLGFGDITFTSDIGRLFSVFVLLSGIVLLLILLPFTFIRLFYAPWLEAQVRLQAPRSAPEKTSGHLVICGYDVIAPGLIERMVLQNIPYYLIESDPREAARLHGEGISVVAGEVDNPSTYQSLRVSQARLILANCNDTTNTNITLTVREIAPNVPIMAIIDEEDSIDILELSGCTHVLPLKQRLGERLTVPINAGHAQCHVIGCFRDLQVAEFPVHNTGLAGRTLRDTRLQETTGVTVVGIWERGRLLPAHLDYRLSNQSVPVIVGTADQILELDTLLVIYDANYNSVIIIGGGKVGRSAARALKRKGIAVSLIEKNESLRDRIGDGPERVIIGDAADREVLMQAGLKEAPAVLLTASDDGENIYLTVYCRRLNPELRIVSRITHERNVEAIYRAGADFVLSHASLGVEHVFSLLQNREMVMLGEGVALFSVFLPSSLVGMKLGVSEISARTGLSVIGIQENGSVVTNPSESTVLARGCELVMLGSTRQLHAFTEIFD